MDMWTPALTPRSCVTLGRSHYLSELPVRNALLNVILIFSRQGTEAMHFKCPHWSRVAVLTIDTAYLPPPQHPGSPCSSHTGLSTLTATYQESSHETTAPAAPFAGNTGPSSGHHKLLIPHIVSMTGPLCRRCPSPPCLKHPTSHIQLHHRCFSWMDLTLCYSFVCLPSAWLCPGEDKLQE